MDKGYLDKRRTEQVEIIKTTFWQDFIKLIEEYRKDAVNRCIDSKQIDTIKHAQGIVYIIDRIFEIPDKLWKQGTTSEEHSEENP